MRRRGEKGEVVKEWKLEPGKERKINLTLDSSEGVHMLCLRWNESFLNLPRQLHKNIHRFRVATGIAVHVFAHIEAHERLFYRYFHFLAT